MADVRTPLPATSASEDPAVPAGTPVAARPARTPDGEGGPVVDETPTTDEATSASTPPVDTDAAPPAVATAAPAGSVEIECPECGLSLVSEGDAPRASANWFCPRCDYPLFWVTRPEARPPTDLQKRARRRLPGTGGTTVLGAEKCWHCGEMNAQGVNACLRCAATLPKPTPPELPAPVIHVHRHERIVVRATVWPYVCAALLAGAAVTLAIANAIHGVS